MDTQLASPPTLKALTREAPRIGGPPWQGPTAPSLAVGLAMATMEALLGRRGLHQLRPWMRHAAFRQLAAHVDSGMFDRSVLGSLRTQMPTPFALEASARISLDARWLACTVRLDKAAEQWQCSDVTVVGAREMSTAAVHVIVRR